MTPAYKARVVKRGGQWRARRPVLRDDPRFYGVERQSFPTWEAAMVWVRQGRPRPAGSALRASVVDAVTDSFAVADSALRGVIRGSNHPLARADVKLAA